MAGSPCAPREMTSWEDGPLHFSEASLHCTKARPAFRGAHPFGVWHLGGPRGAWRAFHLLARATGRARGISSVWVGLGSCRVCSDAGGCCSAGTPRMYRQSPPPRLFSRGHRTSAHGQVTTERSLELGPGFTGTSGQIPRDVSQGPGEATGKTQGTWTTHQEPPAPGLSLTVMPGHTYLPPGPRFPTCKMSGCD